ncbi:MAG: hypothetical protein ABSF26_19070 [Thermoguttaceae bacterium]
MLVVGLAAAVAVAYRVLRPALANPWTKWPLLACLAAAFSLAAWRLLVGFAWPRLAGYSRRQRVAWLALSLLAGWLLVVVIPLPPPLRLAADQSAAAARPPHRPSNANPSGDYTPPPPDPNRRPALESGAFSLLDAVAIAALVFAGTVWLATRRGEEVDKGERLPSPFGRGAGGEGSGDDGPKIIDAGVNRPHPSPLPEGEGTGRDRWAWLRYALPCAAAWSYYLKVCWPALMSPDSFDQWRQVVENNYVDRHPVFHTFHIWLITRVWDSPAAVAAVQICAASALVGWGLAIMRRLGMPRGLAWATSILCAVAPALGGMVVTLWKDIAYGLAVLALTLLVLQMVDRGGAWLERKRHVLLLGLVAALVALYRYNGPPVALATLAILAFAYRGHWRQVAVAAALAVGIFFTVRGPLYQAVGVQPPEAGLAYQPFTFQIAAHLAYGTPTSPDEKQLLAHVHPLVNDRWPYNPHHLGALWGSPQFSIAGLTEHRYEVARLCISLMLRRPQVSLLHMADSSDLIWRIRYPEGSFAETLYVWLNGKTPGRLDPDMRLIRCPQSYSLTKPLWGRTPPGLFTSPEGRVGWLLWRPALLTYLLLLGAVIAALRSRNRRYLLVAMPVLVQSLLLAPICPTSCLRYQWSAYLAGLLLSGFLLLGVPRGEPGAAGEH